MAKQRFINTKFWDDGYIVTLGRSEKLLFLYLLTNPLTNIAGCYEITLKRMAFDTGIPEKELLRIFEKFKNANRVTYQTGWVAVHNFIKNQSINPRVEKGIEIAVSGCPDWIKQGLSIGFDRLSHLNSDSDLNSDLNSDSDLSVGAISPIGEPAKPKPKKKPAVADERKDHPAIKAVLEVSSRWPIKDLWNRIIREIGETPDIAFMTACYETWRGVNGNPQNFEAWLFEPNKTHKLPEIFSKEKKNGTFSNNQTTVRAQRAVTKLNLIEQVRTRIAAEDRELSEQDAARRA